MHTFFRLQFWALADTCAWIPWSHKRPDIRMLLDLPVSSRLIAAGWQRTGQRTAADTCFVGQTFESSFVQAVSVDSFRLGPPHGSKTKSQKQKAKSGGPINTSQAPASPISVYKFASAVLFCFSPPVHSAFRRLHRSDSVVLLSHAGLASHIWKTYSSRSRAPCFCFTTTSSASGFAHLRAIPGRSSRTSLPPLLFCILCVFRPCRE